MGSHQEWRVETVDETGSTNADVAERFRTGEEPGLVLVAEHQTAGRGRLDRSWESPPGASLVLSILLTPDAEPERWPWLPLATGMAVARAVGRVAGVAADLKWPNDVLIEGQKVAGILVERVERLGVAAAVVGIGINVSQTREELPVPGATSLDLASGGHVDRNDLLETLLVELEQDLARWEQDGEVRRAYVSSCVTLGQQVRVAVPGGEVFGEAVDVDEGGRLVVHTAEGEERLGAGDVVHVRPQE
jgi:BirA family transcriptional regulator, biotin operon repressor / biotin---[acetyl-CoA-carboxylase] ligase